MGPEDSIDNGIAITDDPSKNRSLLIEQLSRTAQRFWPALSIVEILGCISALHVEYISEWLQDDRIDSSGYGDQDKAK